MKRITTSCYDLVHNVRKVLKNFPAPELEPYKDRIEALDPVKLENALNETYTDDIRGGFHHVTEYDSGAKVTLITNPDTVDRTSVLLEEYLSLMEEIHGNRELMEREPNLEAFLKYSISNVRRQLSESPDSLDWMQDDAWTLAFSMHGDLEKVPTAQEAAADDRELTQDYFAFLRAVNDYYDGLEAGKANEELSGSRGRIAAAAEKLAHVSKDSFAAWFDSGYGARRRVTDTEFAVYNSHHGMGNVGAQLERMSNAMANGLTAEEVNCLRCLAAPAEAVFKEFRDTNLTGPFSETAEAVFRDISELIHKAVEGVNTGFANDAEKKAFFEDYYSSLDLVAQQLDHIKDLLPPEDRKDPVYTNSAFALTRFQKALLTDSGPVERARNLRYSQLAGEMAGPEDGAGPLSLEKNSFARMRLLECVSTGELDSILKRALYPDQYELYLEARDRQIDNLVRLENGNASREDILTAASRWLPGVAGSIFIDPEASERVFRETLYLLPRERAEALAADIRNYVPGQQRTDRFGNPRANAQDPLITKHIYDMTAEERAAFRNKAGHLAAGRPAEEVQKLRDKLDLLDALEHPAERLWSRDMLLEAPVLRPEVMARIDEIRRDMDLIEQVTKELRGDVSAKEYYRCDHRDFYRMIEIPPELSTDNQKRIYVREWITRYMDVPEGRKQCLDEYYDRLDRRDLKQYDLRCFSKDGDPTPVQPDGLTASEHDFIEYVLHANNTQTRNMKGMTENPDYFRNRYRTERARMLFTAATDRDIFGATIYFAKVLKANGYDLTAMKQMQMPSVNLPNTAERIEQQQGMFVRRRAALLGQENRSDISIRLYDGAAADPEDHAVWLHRINTVLQNAASGQKMNDSMRRFMQEIYSDNMADAGLTDHEKNAVDAKFGLEEIDGLFVDGRPLKEYVGTKYGDYETASELDKGVIRQYMKAEFMAAAMSGAHRTERAELLMGPDGSYKVQVVEYKINSHILDQDEKLSEHNAARRAFDFAATKIKTRADKQDELWKNDPDKEKRQEEIRTRMSEKVVRSYYAMENERERSEHEAARAAEAAAAAASAAPVSSEAAERPAAPTKIPMSRAELEAGVKPVRQERKTEAKKPVPSKTAVPKDKGEAKESARESVKGSGHHKS